MQRQAGLRMNSDQLIEQSRHAIRQYTVRLAAGGVFVALSVTGCGTPTNGLEEKSAAEILRAATAAIEGASGVHVTGIGISEGSPVEVDLRIQDGTSHGTITIEDARLEITTVGTNAFVQGGQQALEALGIPPAAAQLGAGRWLRLSEQEASALEGFSLDSFAAQLGRNDSPLDQEVEQTELDGTKVVVVTRQDGSKLYVSNTDDAYPLRAEDQGQDPAWIDFTEYGADFDIAAPQGTVELSELVWLDAVEKLSTRMDEIMMNSPTNLTPTALASLGDQLRDCSRELARIGLPSTRLQPVHALVANACAEYDEGAECFATAAGIGIPIAGTAADREQTEALDCGFAASGNGLLPLLDALNKGAEMTRAAS
jgi:hypothetical protein